jgi:hypothetical protein
MSIDLSNLSTVASLIVSVPATSSHFTRQRPKPTPRPGLRRSRRLLVSLSAISSSHFTPTINNTKYQLPPSNPHSTPHLTSWIETDNRANLHSPHSAAPCAHIGRRRVTACLRLSHFRPKCLTKDTTNSNNLTLFYHLQLSSATLHLNCHLSRRARRSRQRTSSTASLHNNGFNTSTNLAPRAYAPISHAWSSARQLRAILPTQIKARYSTEQPLRILKLRPPSQAAAATRDHATNDRKEGSLRFHALHLTTLVASVTSTCSAS